MRRVILEGHDPSPETASAAWVSMGVCARRLDNRIVPLAMAACLCITSAAFADPPKAPPPDNSTYVPPAVNPALPVVTVSTMPVPVYVRAPDTESRTAAWIMTGAAAAFAIATESWWLYRDTFEKRGIGFYDDPRCQVLTGVSNPACYITTPEDKATKNHNEHVWNLTELSFAAGLGVSAFVAAYLWSRHFHPLQQVGFTPANGGGSVWIGGQL